MELGMTFRANGNYPGALNAYNLALEEWRNENNLPSQANVLNSLGVLYQYQGDYELAVQSFEKGLNLARSSKTEWLESFLLTSLGDLYVDLGEYNSAFRAYSTAIQVAHQVNYQYLINYLGLAQARLARLQKKLQEAHTFLRETEVFVLASKSNYEIGFLFLEKGILALMENNTSTAITNLDQALANFRNGGFIAESIWSRLWLAATYCKMDNIPDARMQLKMALDSNISGKFRHPIILIFRQVGPWLSALENDPDVGTLLTLWMERASKAASEMPDLLKKLRRILNNSPIQAPHLKIQAFGKALVWVDGKLVTSSRWKTTSVRELFFYFLGASRPLTKEEIGESLWPELSTPELKLRFKNELYRLRHALGKNVIRFENNLYSFNRLVDYDYDVENFNTTIAKSNSTSSVEKRIPYLLEATSIRTGPYLRDMDATWVFPERESSRQSVYRRMVAIGRFSASKRGCKNCIICLSGSIKN